MKPAWSIKHSQALQKEGSSVKATNNLSDALLNINSASSRHLLPFRQLNVWTNQTVAITNGSMQLNSNRALLHTSHRMSLHQQKCGFGCVF